MELVKAGEKKQMEKRERRRVIAEVAAEQNRQEVEKVMTGRRRKGALKLR